LGDIGTNAREDRFHDDIGAVEPVFFASNMLTSEDETVRLWDAVTGAALRTLGGHSNSVTSVAFSPDGKPYDKVTLETLSDLLEQLHCLSVSNDWVVEGSRNILWLSPDYRATCVAVWNGIVLLGHSSGSISFLKFKQGSQLI
jgi:WD40 repeat protein